MDLARFGSTLVVDVLGKPSQLIPGGLQISAYGQQQGQMAVESAGLPEQRGS